MQLMFTFIFLRNPGEKGLIMFRYKNITWKLSYLCNFDCFVIHYFFWETFYVSIMIMSLFACIEVNIIYKKKNIQKYITFAKFLFFFLFYIFVLQVNNESLLLENGNSTGPTPHADSENSGKIVLSHLNSKYTGHVLRPMNPRKGGESGLIPSPLPQLLIGPLKTNLTWRSCSMLQKRQCFC